MKNAKRQKRGRGHLALGEPHTVMAQPGGYFEVSVDVASAQVGQERLLLAFFVSSSSPFRP